MLLFHALFSLTKTVPNRYLLVNVVARRARQIAEDAELEGIHLTEKPVTEARWLSVSTGRYRDAGS